MAQTMTVAIERDLGDTSPGFREQVKRLEADGRFVVRFLNGSGSDAIPADELRDVDLCVLMGKRRIDESSLAGAERLKWLGRFGAGFENVDIDACNRHAVILSNSPYGIRQPVAELVMAYIFAHTTRLRFFDRYIRERGFEKKGSQTTRCVSGRTLGLIGCGGIAQCLIELVTPLKMNLLAYDPHVDRAAMAERGVKLVSMDEVFGSADFVSVHVPLTDETRGLITERHFRMMKPTAQFINTSRGGIYSDAVLAKVLDEGVIAGAALDVFEDEPDVADNPLLKCERAILTPHTAGAGNNIDSMRMVMESLVDSIFLMADGQLPGSILNPEAVPEEVPVEKLSPSFNPLQARS